MLLIQCLGCKKNADSNDNEQFNSGNENISINIAGQQKKIYFSFNKITTDIVERVWGKIELKRLIKIGGIENQTLLKPSRIKVDNKGNIYILDIAESSVKKFSSTGLFIKKYGQKGKGPGEFTRAYDFDIDTTGKIAVLGPNEGKFSVFYDDTVIESKSKLLPIELCFASKSEVATLQIMDPLSYSPISKTNFKEGKELNYNNFLSKKSFEGENYGMLPFLIGDIHRYQLDKLVYISSIMGYVVLYDDNGNIISVFKLINTAHQSALRKREDKIKGSDFPLVRFPRKDEYLFMCTNIWGDNLYVFSDYSNKNEDNYVIDVYSISNERYKYSFNLSGIGKIVSVFITKSKIYIIKLNTEALVYNYVTD